MSNAAWRKIVLRQRASLLSAWPWHFPRHDFVSLRLIQPPPSRADSYWDGESWARAAAAYHEERKRNSKVPM
jgi:hypothetical protein